MSKEEMDELRKRLQPVSSDGRFEHYKMSLQYDNPQARFAHGYPIDTAQNEVKQMIKETENTGHPYPEMKQ
jgi:hypothetical protein